MSLVKIKVDLGASPRGISIVGPDAQARFTQEDLDSAFADGRNSGNREASERYEAALADSRRQLDSMRDGLFAVISTKFEAVLVQLRLLLPDLVSLSTERVLAGCEVDRSVVLAVVKELLADLGPGNEKLEVRLSSDDLQLLEGKDAELRSRFPAIEFRADPDLGRGDCVVATRFGVVDGRISTKLRSLGGIMT